MKRERERERETETERETMKERKTEADIGQKNETWRKIVKDRERC